MCDDAQWVLLEMVRGKPAVVRADEFLEVQPRAPCQAPQHVPVAGR